MRIFYIIIFLISLSSLGLSQEKPEELPEVVVTANRIQESLEETTAKTTLISLKEIDKTNVIFLSDLLRNLSGSYVTSYGGPGKTTGIILSRSVRSFHTLVLIDGIKVNDPTTGMFDFGSLNIDDIEKIEIVEGPQSTFYGSEAVGGVINIITKRGKGKPKINLSLESGSYGSYKPSLEISGKIKNWDFRLNSFYYNTEGFSAYKKGKEKDGFENSFLSVKTGLKILPNLNMEFLGRYNYGENEYDSPPIDANNIQKGKNYLLAGNINLELFKNWKQTLSLSKNYSQRKDYYHDWGFYTKYITQIEEIIWQNEILPFEFYNFLFGIDYRKEKAINEGNYDKKRESLGLFINNKLNLKKNLILNFGLRYDDYKKFGEKTTYRLGLNYFFSKFNIRVKANYGTAFRVPTFDDLFYPDVIWARGNPNLKPEESKGWDIGVEKNLWNNKINFSLTFFYQKYKNLIEWMEIIPWTWQPQNIGSAILKGFENTLNLNLTDHFSLKMSYTYLDSEDKEKEKYLPYKPSHKLFFSIDYTLSNFSFIADYIFTEKRYADKENRQILSSYSLINLSTNYKLRPNLIIFGRAENILNTNYEEVKNYNTPGRSLYIGVKFNY